MLFLNLLVRPGFLVGLILYIMKTMLLRDLLNRIRDIRFIYMKFRGFLTANIIFSNRRKNRFLN